MSYDFDRIIDRSDTHCLKWEFEYVDEKPIYKDRAQASNGNQRLLPLWVADMDFQSPPAVIEALEERARHGIFGYSQPADCYYEAVQAWMQRRYGRLIEAEWVLLTPGVVSALKMIVQSYTAPGDKVLVQPPVYYPFYTAVEQNNRVIVRNPLRLVNGRYEMDFDDLARKTADPAVKMAILCSPHNPVGRVWTPQELKQFGDICRANNVLVIADELHCDLIYEKHTFTSYAAISEAFARESIVCTAPSKTFNLAGLKTSNIVIPDLALREKLAATIERNGVTMGSPFGLVACEAAYRHGEEWLEAVKAYIEDNFRFMKAYMAEHLPQARIIPPEGTYLVWVDFSSFGLTPEERTALLMNEARVWLDEGQMFGPEGADFERLNIACPRAILAEALERLCEVLKPYQTSLRSDNGQ